MSYDGSIKFDTKLDEKGFSKGVKGLEGIAKKSFGLVKSMAKAASVAVVGIGAASLKVGSDFEAGMSEVKAISGATGDEFEALSNKAKEMGATTKFSATESAEALKYMGMAGWKSEQMLAGLPGVMHLAAASGEELGMVSDIVTDALSAFKMEAGEASKFADLLANTSTNSNTNVAMMGETFKYVAPVAGALGYSAEDAALGIGLMANAGIKASQSGTAMRGMMTRMVKPTKESAAAMEMLGLKITDSNDQMKPFKEVMEDIRSGMTNFTPEIQAQIAAMLAGQNGMSGLLAIVNATEEDFNKLTEATTNYNGAAKDMEKIMNDNLQGDFVLLKSALEGVGVELYESSNFAREFIQSFTGIIEVINNTIKGAGEVSREFEEMSDSLGGAQLALGGTEELMDGMKFGLDAIGQSIADFVATALIKLTEAIPTIIEITNSMIQGLIDGFTENKDMLTESISDIFVSIIEMFIINTPLFMEMGIEFITAIAMGIAESTPDLMETFMGAIGSLVDTIIENAPLMMEAGANILLGIMEGITENADQIGSKAIEIVQMVAEGLMTNIPLLLTAGVEMLQALVDGFTQNPGEIIAIGLDLVITLADAIISNIPTLIQIGLDILLALTKGIMENLPTLIAEVPRIINEFTDALMDMLPQMLITAALIMKELAVGLIKAIPTLVANIPAIIRAVINAFLLYNWAQLGGKIVTSISNGFKNLGGNLVSAAVDLGRNTVNAIKLFFRAGTQTGAGLVKNLIGGIKSLVGNLLGLAGELALDALAAIGRGFMKAPQIGKDLVKGLWNGIANMTGWLMGKIKGFADGVIDGVKGFFGIHSPSRVFRDEIGTQLVRGIIVGIQDETPALRQASEKEMMKLVDDYAVYGRKAAEAYGQLNKEEMAELRKQHIKERKITAKMTQKEINEVKKQREQDGKDLAEAIAKGIEAKTDTVVAALEKLREQSIRELDKLGDATIKALKSRYKEEEDLLIDSLNKRLDIEKSESQKRIDIYEREQRAKILLLDEEQSETVRILQSQIEAINKELEAEEDANEEREYQNKLAEAKEQARVAKTNRERLEAEEKIQSLITEKERKDFKKRKQQEIQNLKDSIKAVEDNAKDKIANLEEDIKNHKEHEEEKLKEIERGLENEREAIKAHYEILTKEENLQAEARKLILAENNEELIELLDSYNPYWMDAGQSFGESLLEGLNSMKYEIEDVVNDMLSMVATAERANAQIIQAKLDYEDARLAGDKKGMEKAHKQAETYRKQGGTIGSDIGLKTANYEREYKQKADSQASMNPYSRGITQNINIVSPENTPAENARQMKRKGEELLYGY